MRPTDKATADSRSVQSFAIIKNTGHGNCFTLAVFTLELEMDYPSETSLCTVTPSLTDTPSPNLVPRALFPGFGGPAPKAREKRPGDEVVLLPSAF